MKLNKSKYKLSQEELENKPFS